MKATSSMKTNTFDHVPSPKAKVSDSLQCDYEEICYASKTSNLEGGEDWEFCIIEFPSLE